MQSRGHRLLEELNATLAASVRAQLIACLVVGSLSGVGFALILAMLAGVELDGIAGIFIAVPVVALVTVAARHWLAWRERDADPEPVEPAASTPPVTG